MAFEPGALARARKANGQHHRTFRLSRRGAWLYLSLRRHFSGHVGFSSFPGRPAWRGQSWCLSRGPLATASSPPSAAPIAISPKLLPLAFAGRSISRGLRLLRLWLLRWLSFKLGLPALRGSVRLRLGKLGLQRRGIVLGRFFRRGLTAPIAVACPSAHVALVTRLPIWEQFGAHPFRGSVDPVFCDP